MRMTQEWRTKNPEKRLAINRKASDLRKYGTCVDNEKTAKRRAIEERRELADLGLMPSA